MSRLSSLFSNPGESESNDALKYSAPKEPKPSRASKDPATNSLGSSAATAVGTTPKIATATKPNPASKICVASTIRLFKLNSLTNGYEPHENGQPLGLVIVGAGSTYQILIYNGQKVPQCVVPLTAQFQYTIQDLYMSLSDSSGTGWSILFDSSEILTNVLRHILVIMAHLWGQSDADSQPSSGFYKEICPYEAGSSASDDDTVLAVGMAAGIYYTVRELSDDVEYITDVLSQPPLLSLQAPDDVAKVKLGNTNDDLFPNFHESLVGGRKGGRILLAVSPRLAYSGTMDLSLRKFPSSWIILEIEIAKVKSEKDKKKEKTKKESPAAAATVDASHSHESYNSNQSREASDITARMAFLSKQGSGGNAASQIAMAIGKSSPNLSGRKDGSQRSESRSESFTLPSSADSVPQPHQTVSNPSHGGNSPTQPSPAANQMPRENHIPSNYQNLNSVPFSASTNQFYDPSQAYALAVVPGQESRSYYGDFSQQQNQAPNHHHQQQQQQPQHAGHFQAYTPQAGNIPSSIHPSMSYGYPPSAAPSYGMIDPSPVNMMHSIQQLHVKIDQMTASMNSSASLKPFGVSQRHGGNGNPIKVKADDLIALVQSMIEEYNKMADENVSSSSRETITKLQDKIELLQDKNEKLMNEKATLLEKHSSLLESGANSNSKFFSLQQEVDLLRREKAHLQQQADSFQSSIEKANFITRSAELDKGKITQLEQEVMSLQTSLNTIKSERANHLTVINQLNEEISTNKSQIMRISQESSTLRSELADAQSKLKSLDQSHSVAIDVTNPAVQALIEEKMEEQTAVYDEKLSDLQDKLASLESALRNEKALRSNAEASAKERMQELSSTLAKNEALKQAIEEKQNEILDLQQNASGSGLSEEAVKTFMQDIYTKAMDMFSNEDADSPIYSSTDVIKRIRNVLKTVTNERMNK